MEAEIHELLQQSKTPCPERQDDDGSELRRMKEKMREFEKEVEEMRSNSSRSSKVKGARVKLRKGKGKGYYPGHQKYTSSYSVH